MLTAARILAKVAEPNPRAILAAAGINDPGPLERAFSYSNDVFVGREVVLRVARPTSWTSPAYERAVLAMLPATVPHAEVLDAGVHDGREWMLLRRATGEVLGRRWPRMSRDERRRVVHQLGQALAALHALPLPTGWQRPDLMPEALARRVTPPEIAAPFQQPPARVHAIADAARTLPGVDHELIDEAEALVAARLPLFAAHRRALVHADLHSENVMVDGDRLTAVLDFEAALPAAPDLELDVPLRFCAWPHLPVAKEYEAQMRPEDFRDVPAWLAEAYPALFAGPNLRERLEVYAVVYDLRLGVEYPGRPDPSAPPWQTWNRLRATVDGRGYLRAWF